MKHEGLHEDFLVNLESLRKNVDDLFKLLKAKLPCVFTAWPCLEQIDGALRSMHRNPASIGQQVCAASAIES